MSRSARRKREEQPHPSDARTLRGSVTVPGDPPGGTATIDRTEEHEAELEAAGVAGIPSDAYLEWQRLQD